MLISYKDIIARRHESFGDLLVGDDLTEKELIIKDYPRQFSLHSLFVHCGINKSVDSGGGVVIPDILINFDFQVLAGSKLLRHLRSTLRPYFGLSYARFDFPSFENTIVKDVTDVRLYSEFVLLNANNSAVDNSAYIDYQINYAPLIY